MARPASRKQRRKEERQAKKVKNALHFSKKTACTETEGCRGGARKAPSRVYKGSSDDIRSKRGPRNTGSNRPQKTNKETADTSREDREIAKMEKLLGLKKMKKLPATFEAEGFTYLLDVLDKGEKGNYEDLSEDEQEGGSQSGSDGAPEEAKTWTSRAKRSGSAATARHTPGIVDKGLLRPERSPSTSSEDLRPNKRVRFNVDKDAKNSKLHLPDVEGVLHPGDKEEEEEGEEDGDDNDDDGGVKEEEDMEDGGEEESDEDGEEEIDEDGEEESDEVGEEKSEEDGEESDGLEEDGDGGEEEEESDGEMGDDIDEAEREDVEDVEGEGNDTEGGEVALKGEGQCGEERAKVAAECRYVPPHLREKDKSKQLEKLKKRIQGLVNRLSESNMQSISSQLEQLYLENSRNDMNTALTEVLLKACISPVMLGDRFVLEHCMLLALLHCHLGAEVGAYFVQTLARRLSELLKMPPNYGVGKECNCVVAIFAHLYNYKIIHCILIYDIIRCLISTFTERDIELLLLLLKNTGMEIRRDDATALKDITMQIQTKAAANPALKDSSRSKFMLETIAAIKSNNPRKIPQYDPSLLDHMRKHLRGLMRSPGKEDEGQLKITFQDLLEANEKGRWWIVGSAWTGREARANNATPSKCGSEAWVLDLARKQRMNTDVRKNIFCILMTSEDYIDAFEKLLKLHLNDVQDREIVHVLVDCCLQERVFNPYYGFLGQKLCEFKRSHKVTFQFSLWDRIKALDTLSSSCQANLWKLTSHLIATKALSLALLKVVEFTELSSNGTKFLKNLLRSLLRDYSCELTSRIFSHLVTQPTLRQLKEQILVFIKCFLQSSDEDKVVAERVKMVEEGMRTNS